MVPSPVMTTRLRDIMHTRLERANKKAAEATCSAASRTNPDEQLGSLFTELSLDEVYGSTNSLDLILRVFRNVDLKLFFQFHD